MLEISPEIGLGDFLSRYTLSDSGWTAALDEFHKHYNAYLRLNNAAPEKLHDVAALLQREGYAYGKDADGSIAFFRRLRLLDKVKELEVDALAAELADQECQRRGGSRKLKGRGTQPASADFLLTGEDVTEIFTFEELS